MYFDFDDLRPDAPRLNTAISRREGVLLSIIGHLCFAILLIASPDLFPSDPEAARERARIIEEQLREQEEARFVFVQPLVERPAPAPPPRAELSDLDRQAQSPEQAPEPVNELPFARGNTFERVEEVPPPPPAGEGPDPEPAQADQEVEQRAEQQQAPSPESDAVLQMPVPPPPQVAANDPAGRSAVPGGSLGDAFRNLQRYVETFDNPGGGGGQFGPEIQFDTKGVEFGPWIRRFVAQVKRNWYVPYSAMSMSGRVVIQFNVHKNGMITDLSVVQPCPIEAFNAAAYGALAASNPTQPLPAAYPIDRAFFTVTFFYNEPPQ